MNILVVDDEPINRDVLAAGLRARGHTVVTAGDGSEALQVVDATVVDAVIADILMPRMDGYRLCHELRRRAGHRRLPFVFYTASFTTAEDERLCYEVGGDGLVRKPAPIEEVLAALDAARLADRRGRTAPEPGPEVVLKDYSERLVRKLEDTNVELAAAVDELRSARDLKTAILEAALDSVVAMDHQGRIVEFNPAAEAAFGMAREQALGQVMAELLVPPRWREAHYRGFARYIGGGEARIIGRRVELEALRADGSEFPIEISVRAIRVGAQPIFTAFIRDITERKRAEAALRASEGHFRALFEQAADGMVLMSPDLICRDANARCGQLLGYTPGELVGMNLAQLVTERERPLIAGEVTQPAVRRPYRREWDLVRKNGATFIADLTAARLSDGQVLLTLRDISDRRRAEDALRESERRFTDMLRNLELLALMLDGQGRVTYCNDYLLRVTGWERADVLGKNWFTAFVPTDDARSRMAFRDLLADKPSAWHQETEIVTRAGERRLIHWSNTVLRSGSGEVTGTASIGEDITLHRQIEDDRRRRAAELENFHRLSVGRELRMIELKQEINALARRAGQPEPYDLSFVEKA